METQAEIRRLLAALQSKAPAGFATAFHIRYTTPLYLFQTYAKDWIAHYSQKGLLMQDPIVAWTFTNTGWIRWADLHAQDPAGVLQQAQGFGMNYGFAFGYDKDDSRSVAGFSRSDREFTDAEIADIIDIFEKLHDLTASAGTFGQATQDALRKMTIEFTHP